MQERVGVLLAGAGRRARRRALEPAQALHGAVREIRSGDAWGAAREELRRLRRTRRGDVSPDLWRGWRGCAAGARIRLRASHAAALQEAEQ